MCSSYRLLYYVHVLSNKTIFASYKESSNDVTLMYLTPFVKHMQTACMGQWLKDSLIFPPSFKPFSLSWSKGHTTVECWRLDSTALGLQITQREGRHLPLAILRSSPIPGSAQIQSVSYPAPRSAKQFYLPPIQIGTHYYGNKNDSIVSLKN